MSTPTILCFDATASLLDRLTAKFSDCSVRQVETAVATAAWVEPLLADGGEVAVAIAPSAWLATGALQAVYDHFPQALTVALGNSTGTPNPAATPQAVIYRCLPYPGSDDELIFTVTAALGHYRQGQQLALGQAALAEAHQQLAAVERRLSALAVQLDWGVSSLGDHAQMERALRQSQSSLAEAQRIAQMGSWEFELASQTITWSAELFRIYGLAPNQPAPSYAQWRQTIPSADWPPLEAAIERAIAVGMPYEVEHRIVRPDGSIRYILARGEAVYNDQGQVVQLRGTGQDRTAARLAELALEQSEAHNRAILSAVPDLMIVMSAAGQYLDFSANGFTGNLVPLAAQGPVGATIADALPAEVAHQWLETIARTLATETTHFFEQQLRFGDRTQYEVVRMVPYQADQVLVVVRDISDRKQLEQEQRQAEARFRQLAETVREGFFVFDALALCYEYVNPAYAAITGADLATIDDQQHWLTRVHPDDRDRIAALAVRELQGEAIDCEYRFLHPDGDLRWLRCQGFPLTDEQGVVLRIVGILDDITERKRTELALEQAEERYRRATQAAGVGVWELNLATYTGYLDPTITLLVGHRPEAVDNTLDQWLTLIHPGDRDRLEAAIRACLRGESAEFFVEYRMLHRDGSVIWVLSRGELHRDAAGQPKTFLGTTTDVTPLKQAELALKQLNEELEQRVKQRTLELQTLAAVVENSTDLIGTASLSGTALYLNPAGRDLLGLGDAALAGRSVTSFFKAEAVTQFEREGLPAVMAKGVWQGESLFCHSQTDEAIAVEQVMFLVKDPETHRPLCIAIIGRDIRDRKRSEAERQQAERSLKASEERFRGTFEQAALGIIETELNGRIVRVNQMMCHLLGYSASDLLTKTCMELTHPDDLELNRARVRQLLSGECADFKLEKRYLRADGAVVWVSLAVSLVRDGLGTPQYLLGVVNDISEQRAAQRERDRAENQLQEQEQFLRSIYEGVNQPICVSEIAIDGTVTVLGLNPAAATLFGRPSADLAGKSLAAAFGPVEADSILQRYRYCVETNQPLTFERSIEAEGQVRWLIGTYSPISDATGRVYRIVGSMYDITDRKRTEEALKTLNQKLEQRVQERTWELEQAVAISEAASQAKSTFLANMSHELRTPLNAILGFAQLMARDSALSADHHQALSIVNRSGEHLLMLINDILEMAKIEAGQVNLNASSFDLDALLSTLNDMFCLRAQNKGLSLITDRHPALPSHFKLDVAKLRQVLINLLGNAIKFTPQGQVTLRVAPTYTIAAAPPGTVLTVTFTVSDTGIGLAAADRDRLFEPFVQASQGGLGGTGLGLSISRQFVRMLGGDITVESELGQGSTFAFTLPMPVVEAEQRAATPAQAAVIGLAAGQPDYRLLVVDDNEDHRYLLSQLLQSVGFEVREAINGAEAIALWQSWQPQLIWLDMRMPVMSGYEAAQAIRAQEQAQDRDRSQPPTIIIALTANAFEDDRARAIDNGCDDFVRKPFQANHLLAKLTEHLGVQYSYSPLAPSSGPQPLAHTEAIALLSGLSDSLLDQLQQATLQLDGDRLIQLMAQFSEAQNPLVAWLTQQIEDFAFDTIHDLIKQAKSAE
ncbi:PAS domain S-box protein [Nodosilinea sp. AN01ver1]|uniref:PAS domain-containing hybrid sensor histidine kinase/response regulator n=1 Tax=Nodosilinea sp. AN01ver1 TaxID=3423362 RepID=UPI003D316450